LSTIWLPGEPRGVQRPPVLARPPSVSSSGEEAADLAASAGLVLDPWQRFSLDVMLAERSDFRWAAFETGCLVARQNGKGGIIEALGLAALFLFEERLTLYSAHQFKTAQEHFLRLMGLIENTPWMRKLCKKPRTSHGEEGFERLDGARFRFVARSRQSARGFTGDRLIVDEAQELSRSAMGAILPTLSTRPNPQVNYFGTPPEETNDSEHWESLRDRGRAGDDGTLAWLEWSAQTDDLDDEEGWAQANPALGIRLSREAILRERASLDDEQFGRERLTLWGAGSSKQVIDPDVWFSLTDEKSKRDPKAKVAFAVDIPPDRKSASIAVAADRKDGLRHVEVVERRSGTAWAVGRLVELAEKVNGEVALDPSSPAGSLLTGLMEAGIEPQLITGREMTQACGLFYDMAMADDPDERTLRHIGQPRLNTAVDAGRKRNVLDAWAWHRRDSESDISPLVAVTLANFVLGKPSKRREVSGEASFF
jgi:hypothetical protein